MNIRIENFKAKNYSKNTILETHLADNQENNQIWRGEEMVPKIRVGQG